METVRNSMILRYHTGIYGTYFLQIKNRGFASLSEGIPKLLSAVNLASYFWDVCFQEISAKIKSK